MAQIENRIDDYILVIECQECIGKLIEIYPSQPRIDSRHNAPSTDVLLSLTQILSTSSQIFAMSGLTDGARTSKNRFFSSEFIRIETASVVANCSNFIRMTNRLVLYLKVAQDQWKSMLRAYSYTLHRSHNSNVEKVFREGTVRMNLKIRFFCIAVEELIFIGNQLMSVATATSP